MEKNQASRQHTLSAEPPIQVHLSDYLNIVKRRKRIVILFFMIVVVFVSFISLQMTPVYKATAQIIIEGQSSPLMDLDAKPVNLKINQDYYQTQYNLLRSRSLIFKAIENYDLASYLKEQTKSNHFDFPPAEAASQSTPKPSTDTELINWYLTHLQITPIRSTKLVNISFIGSDRGLITYIANCHAQAAVNISLEKKRSTAQQALDWLRKQLESQGSEVERLQREIYEYKKKYGIISLEGHQSVVHQNLAELNSTLNRVKADRLEKEAVFKQLKSLSSNKNILILPEVTEDSVIQNLRNQVLELKAKRLQMASRYYGPKHPKMIEIDEGISLLQEDIETESNRLNKSLKAELDRALSYEKSIEASIKIQKQLAVSLDEKAILYDVLKKKVENAQTLYEFLLKQAETANLVKSENTSAISIVDPAETPLSPIKPRIFLNILLAIVLGLFMGIGLTFFVEYMDNTLKSPDDVFRRLKLPVLGTLPYQKALKVDKNPALTWDEQNGSRLQRNPAVDLPYKITYQVPAALSRNGDNDRGQVIMVESVTMGEGKTTVLAGMAANFSDTGLQTLMLDCDFQRPSLHLFAREKNEGLANVFEEISTFRLETGRLSECSIGDLFFLMSIKRKSGILYVTNEKQSMEVSIHNGRLIHVQNQNSKDPNRIGTMLLKGKYITREQLNDTLERQQRTGQPLGYLLVNSGYVSRDNLHGPIKLQTEENLQQLFSWKKGEFIFKPSQMNVYGSEKIGFDENYEPLIEAMTEIEGSKLINDALFSRIVAGPGENLFLFQAGKVSNGTRVCATPMLMKRILKILKQRFDVIVIDTPPLDAAAGFPALSSLVDGIVLVVKAGHLSCKSIRQALRQETTGKILGAVLNQVKIKKTSAYSSDYY